MSIMNDVIKNTTLLLSNQTMLEYKSFLVFMKQNLMNKSLRRFLLELGPLLLFFITYRRSGMNHGIIMLIMTTTLSVIISYILEKKIPIIAVIGATFIAVFGGLAIYFNNKIFFFMKPTFINFIFAMALIYTKFFQKKLILKNK